MIFFPAAFASYSARRYSILTQSPGPPGRPVDEFGYLNLKPEQSNTFFKLMEERYTRHSTIITTNLVYDEWQNFLGNKSMVDALLSRVRHYCHTGPSTVRRCATRRAEPMPQHEYVRRLLAAYRSMPGTAGVARRQDRALAAQLHQRGVPLEAVENAFVLAAARRMIRAAGADDIAPPPASTSTARLRRG
jgi:hypothetical protein